MRRRTALVALGLGAAGAAAFLILRRSGLTAEDRLIIIGLRGVFSPESEWALAEMGGLAVKQMGGNSDSARLIEESFSGPRWGPDAGEPLNARLQEQIAEEYAHADVHALGGWIISRTERNLWALFALELPRGDSFAVPETPRDDATTPIAGPGDAVAGKKLYETHCSGCHQRDGGGLGGTTAPDLRTGIAKKSDIELGQIISKGLDRDHGRMPAFDAQLSESQIRDVIAYVRQAFGKVGRRTKSRQLGR